MTQNNGRDRELEPQMGPRLWLLPPVQPLSLVVAAHHDERVCVARGFWVPTARRVRGRQRGRISVPLALVPAISVAGCGQLRSMRR